MNEDIKNYDSPPPPDLPKTDPYLELCTLCQHKTTCKKRDNPWADGIATNHNDTRVIRCSSFLVIGQRVLMRVTEVITVLAFVALVAQGDYIDWIAKTGVACVAVAAYNARQWLGKKKCP